MHKIAFKSLVIILAYIAAGYAGLQLAKSFNFVSPVWPGTGIAIALVSTWGRFYLVPTFIGAALLNNLNGLALLPSCLIGSGTVLEIWLGSYTFQKVMTYHSRYTHYTETFSVILASVIAPVIAASVGVTVLSTAGMANASNWLNMWCTWWSGDFLGAIVFIPVTNAILDLSKDLKIPSNRRFVCDILVWSTVGILSTYFVFSVLELHPYMFALFFVVFAAVAFSHKLTSRLTSGAMVGTAMLLTAGGLGPFATGHTNSDLMILQFFLCALFATALILEGFKESGALKSVIPILFIGWTLSGVVFGTTCSELNTAIIKHAELSISNAEEKIRQEISGYANLMKGSEGLFQASKSVERNEWKAYTDALNLEKRYPGILSLGFVAFVDDSKIVDFVLANQKDGAPNFKVQSIPGSTFKPSGAHYILTFIEPEEKFQRVLGMDIATEQTRRAAADLARKSGEAVLSARIQLSSDVSVRPAFILVHPVVLHRDTATKDYFAGWIIVSFAFSEFISGIARDAFTDLEFAIYDEQARDPKSLLTKSKNWRDHKNSTRIISHQLELGRRTFYLDWDVSGLLKSYSIITMTWLASVTTFVTLGFGFLFINFATFKSEIEKTVKAQTIEIRRREKTWRTLTTTAPVGIYKTDPAGNCSYTNPKWREITGQTEEEAFGVGWVNAIYPGDRELVHDSWNRFVQTNGVFHLEFRFQRPNGELRWVSAISRPIYNDDNSIAGYIGIDIDITEKKTQQEAFEGERLKMLEASKMASLGEMAGGVAHEINNPLAVILANANWVRRILNQPTPDLEMIGIRAEKIENTATRIAKIVSGLRNFSRDSQNDIPVVKDIREIVEDTLEFCLERIKNHSIVFTRGRTDSCAILCKPSQMGQVLLNLLNNAFDAVADTPNAWIKLDIVQIESRVEISVTNSGSRIPAEIAEKMMNPFFTTKEIGKGTGLGLSIAFGITESHRGTLYYDSKFENTRFVISLPIHSLNMVA